MLGLDTETNEDGVAVVELADGSIASSSGRGQRQIAKLALGPHVDGRGRAPVAPDRFVCVLAESCMTADALTKVVMANGAASAGVLGYFGASAHVFDGDTGWRPVNGESECA